MSRKQSSGGNRLHLLDTIRGITLCSMMLYHLSWDLVYIVQIPNQNFISFYTSRRGFVWQQSICWTFLLLSGFCIPLSQKRWRRGFVVSGAGILVTLVTLTFLPEDRVIFGVLTLIGAAMLTMALLEPALSKVPPLLGLCVSAYLFYVFRWVNAGFLQLIPGKTITLPAAWYHGMAATFFGFMEPGFYSTDYFSYLPWIFLYLVGYFLYGILIGKKKRPAKIFYGSLPPFSYLGRHSLLVYLLHQPILYMGCELYMNYLR